MKPLHARLGVAVLLAAWLIAQLAWLAVDERIIEGDALTNVGAVELFWEDHPGRSAPGEIGRAYVEDFGEYPAMYAALTGVVGRWLGLTDLNGDGPARVGLLWALAAALATWWLGRALAGEVAGLLAVAVLLLSPQFSAVSRHLMLENGLVATVGLAAAAGFAACWTDDRSRPQLLPWLVCGAAAGLALLIKQTATLALLPLGVGLLASAWRGAPDRSPALRLRGPALAVGAAALLAGPWYLRRLVGGGEGEYLWRSAQANPDAVGPLHQAAYYPLVLLQQPWAPVVLLAAVALAVLVRRAGARPPLPTGRIATLLAVVAAGVLLLALLPKKYPRLLLPLMPLVCAVVGAILATWPARLRGSLLGLAALSWVATCWPLGPLSTILGEGRVGLVDVDERCYQDWIAPPDRPGLDWDRLVALLEEAGGAGTEYRVGAIEWPVPPCAHQTTQHLGEHLRIRVRRAGLEGFVMIGSWKADGAWSEGDPDVLVSDGDLACTEQPAACGLGWESLGAVPLVRPDWSVEARVYRRRR